MRPTCLDCTRKHLAQAHVLLDEFASDPEDFEVFFWFAMGHMAEAEAESRGDYGDLSFIIRAHRSRMEQDDDFYTDFEPLLKLANRYAFLHNGDEIDVDELESLKETCSQPVAEYLCGNCDE